MSSEDDADDFMSEIEKYMEEERRKEHPDYRSVVYCDKHLGVEMRLATSWGSHEYGDTKADVNPNLLWYCPKPGCDRHYKPTMFGYHINEPGRRLRTNGPKQPRGNHPGVPFMYIAKEGEGRRYKCPYYKCDEQGPVVAASIADEDVQLPANPLDDFRGADRKRAVEMLVFQSFVLACGLPIDEGSAENGAQGYPDIGCTISGQPYWFELGQIIHEEVAEKLNPKRRKQDGGFSYDQEKPFVELINAKTSKNYKTEGAPVDLVFHFDHRLGTASTVRRLSEKHRTLLDSLTTIGPFRRVWIFDDYAKELVWRSR